MIDRALEDRHATRPASVGSELGATLGCTDADVDEGFAARGPSDRRLGRVRAGMAAGCLAAASRLTGRSGPGELQGAGVLGRPTAALRRDMVCPLVCASTPGSPDTPNCRRRRRTGGCGRVDTDADMGDHEDSQGEPRSWSGFYAEVPAAALSARTARVLDRPSDVFCASSCEVIAVSTTSRALPSD